MLCVLFCDRCTDDANNTYIQTTSDTCNASIVTERDCKSHTDCAQCLSAWPYHGQVNQVILCNNHMTSSNVCWLI